MQLDVVNFACRKTEIVIFINCDWVFTRCQWLTRWQWYCALFYGCGENLLGLLIFWFLDHALDAPQSIGLLWTK
jgi:hypothetical protein